MLSLGTFEQKLGADFVSVDAMWLSNSRFLVDNMFCAAALWGLWRLRNSLCFQGIRWKDGRSLLLKVIVMLQGWSDLCPKKKNVEFKTKLEKLKHLATRP